MSFHDIGDHTSFYEKYVDLKSQKLFFIILNVWFAYVAINDLFDNFCPFI